MVFTKCIKIEGNRDSFGPTQVTQSKSHKSPSFPSLLSPPFSFFPFRSVGRGRSMVPEPPRAERRYSYHLLLLPGKPVDKSFNAYLFTRKVRSQPIRLRAFRDVLKRGQNLAGGQPQRPTLN